jgi:hypothetical protein
LALLRAVLLQDPDGVVLALQSAEPKADQRTLYKARRGQMDEVSGGVDFVLASLYPLHATDALSGAALGRAYFAQCGKWKGGDGDLMLLAVSFGAATFRVGRRGASGGGEMTVTVGVEASDLVTVGRFNLTIPSKPTDRLTESNILL